MNKIVTLAALLLPIMMVAQKKITYTAPKSKAFDCITFVYNLTQDNMNMKDICYEVIKGEYTNLNEYSITKRKENEFWRFDINIRDNKTLSELSYKGAFYRYENYSQDIIQYHPVNDNETFKAIIFDKLRNSWQILLLQNDEYKILSTYTGYNFTNAFGISSKKKSAISY